MGEEARLNGVHVSWPREEGGQQEGAGSGEAAK
jgi:hypothetical protein